MNEDDFAHVYAEYHKSVLHLAFDILQDYDLSQYICRKVFVKFHKKIKNLDEDHVKGWLLRHGRRESKILSIRFYQKKRVLQLLSEEKTINNEYLYKNGE